ncbi:MAG: proline iminopeptidase-family hydrolase [Thaumarchaeota archaeon]|nr:proline iminopeptidase-family hydrolase [Nitrososphaerota archaeon]
MEGHLFSEGFRIFYTSVGEPVRGTLLGLHGGPGATLDYLKALEDLTNHGYRVVLYNQLGSDKSEVPVDDTYYTVEHYVREVEGVRKELNLGRLHLLGHSWGGMLAIAYALEYQQNLESLIISSGLASVPLTALETERLVSLMPLEAQAILRKYSRQGDFDNPQYLETYQKYVRSMHSFRGAKMPRELEYTLSHINKKVFRFMEGPDDLNMTGTLKDWDVTNRLWTLNIPCLITVGRYDSVTPKVAESIHQHVRGSTMVTFDNSAHFAMWEERELFINTLREFLASTEKKAGT